MQFIAYYSDVFRGAGTEKTYIIEAVDLEEARGKFLTTMGVSPKEDFDADTIEEAWKELQDGEDTWDVQPLTLTGDVTLIREVEY